MAEIKHYFPDDGLDYATATAQNIAHAHFFSSGYKVFAFYEDKQHPDEVQQHSQRLENYLDSMPQVTSGEAVTLKTLTTPNETGRCALENPRVWETCGTWLPQLEKQEIRTILRGENRQGESFLAIGLATAPQTLITTLWQEKTPLEADMLVENSKPKPSLEWLIRHKAIPLLFTAENWKQQSADSLAKVYHSLPEEVKNTLPHYTRLRHDLLGKDIAGRGR